MDDSSHTRAAMFARIGAEAADNMHKAKQRAAALSAARNAVIEAARGCGTFSMNCPCAPKVKEAVRALNELEGKN